MSNQHREPPPTVAHQSPAEILLESLQQRVYASVGWSADDCQRTEQWAQRVVLPLSLDRKARELPAREFARYRDAVFETLSRDVAARRPTRFERPHQYPILRDVQRAIEAAMIRLGWQTDTRLLIGTLPTGRLTPVLLPVPATHELVMLVDGHLLTYLARLARALALTLPLTDVEDGRGTGLTVVSAAEDLVRTSPGAASFVELMRATLEGRRVHGEWAVTDEKVEHVSSELCELMELFVIAREHTRLVATTLDRTRVSPCTAHGQTFDVLTFSLDQEAQADALGLALQLSAVHEEGGLLAWRYWSADVLLATFGILERAAAARRHVTTIDAVMRWYDVRRQRLRDVVGRLPGGHAAVTFVESLDPLVTALEARVQAELETSPSVVH